DRDPVIAAHRLVDALDQVAVHHVGRGLAGVDHAAGDLVHRPAPAAARGAPGALEQVQIVDRAAGHGRLAVPLRPGGLLGELAGQAELLGRAETRGTGGLAALLVLRSELRRLTGHRPRLPRRAELRLTWRAELRLVRVELRAGIGLRRGRRVELLSRLRRRSLPELRLLHRLGAALPRRNRRVRPESRWRETRLGRQGGRRRGRPAETGIAAAFRGAAGLRWREACGGRRRGRESTLRARRLRELPTAVRVEAARRGARTGGGHRVTAGVAVIARRAGARGGREVPALGGIRFAARLLALVLSLRRRGGFGRIRRTTLEPGRSGRILVVVCHRFPHLLG